MQDKSITIKGKNTFKMSMKNFNFDLLINFIRSCLLSLYPVDPLLLCDISFVIIWRITEIKASGRLIILHS